MEKYYFREDNDEGCFPKKTIISQMKNEGIKELKIFEANRDVGSGYFYCKEYDEVGEVKQSCGKTCDGYKPNNGKNGRCKHYGWCYEITERSKVLKLK